MSIKLESNKTLDLTRFVVANDIDYRYFERPYFLTPVDQFPWRVILSSATHCERLAA